MEPEQSVNPYSFTEAAAVEEAPLGNRMPTPLVVLAVLLLLMGGAGVVLNGLAGVGLAVQAAVATAQPPGSADGPRQEFERQLDANNARLMPFTCGSLVINLLLSIPMVVGASGLFLRKEWARVLSLRTIYVNAVFYALEIPFGAVALWMQHSAMNEFMTEFGDAGPFGGSGTTFLYTLLVVQIVVMVLLYAYELAVYWFGASYLRRDAVKAIFA